MPTTEDCERFYAEEQAARNNANPMIYLYEEMGKSVVTHVPESAVALVKHLNAVATEGEKRIGALEAALEEIKEISQPLVLDDPLMAAIFTLARDALL